MPHGVGLRDPRASRLLRGLIDYACISIKLTSFRRLLSYMVGEVGDPFAWKGAIGSLLRWIVVACSVFRIGLLTPGGWMAL